MVLGFQSIRNRMYAVLTVFGCVIAAGCNNTISPSPFLPAILGPVPTIYSGALHDSSGGNGTVAVSLTNAGGLTSGTWQMTFGGKTEAPRLISGTVKVNAYTAIVQECQETNTSSCFPNCHFTFTGTITSASLIGTYTAILGASCPVRSGSINTTKQ